MSKLDELHDKIISTSTGKIRTRSQAEYESRERLMAYTRRLEIERSPLADRKAAAVEFLDAMKSHPEIVAERISWLLDGNYGYGVMLLARQRRIQGSPRMNRLAALTHIIGLHEWGCPQAMAIAAWKKLSSAEKARLDKNIEIVIRQAERGEE